MPEIDEYYWYHTMDLGEGMVTEATTISVRISTHTASPTT